MQIYRFINWDKDEAEGKNAITPNVELIGWSADGSWLVFSPDNEKLAYIAGIGRDVLFDKQLEVADFAVGGQTVDHGRGGVSQGATPNCPPGFRKGLKTA